MTLKELKTHLIEEAEYAPEKVENMSSYQLVEAWLHWEGVIGYTHDIIEVVFSAYNINKSLL